MELLPGVGKKHMWAIIKEREKKSFENFENAKRYLDAVEKGEIIIIDLFMKGTSNFNRVEGAVQDVSTIAKQLVKMYDTKPNMLDLVTYRIAGSNAEIVADKSEADITYGVEDCTYSVDRVDEILAELL